MRICVCMLISPACHFENHCNAERVCASCFAIAIVQVITCVEMIATATMVIRS